MVEKKVVCQCGMMIFPCASVLLGVEYKQWTPGNVSAHPGGKYLTVETGVDHNALQWIHFPTTTSSFFSIRNASNIRRQKWLSQQGMNGAEYMHNLPMYVRISGGLIRIALYLCSPYSTVVWVIVALTILLMWCETKSFNESCIFFHY